MKVKKKYQSVSIDLTFFQANRMENNGSKMEDTFGAKKCCLCLSWFSLSNEYLRIIHIDVLVFDPET